MKDRKSIFEKFGLIEKVEIENISNVGQANQETDENYRDEVSEFGSVVLQRTDEDKDNIMGLENKNLLRSDEIYKNSNIRSEGINSLFIIEGFLKALPDYLPLNIKRESVLNIISSSGIKFESLVSDGNVKLKSLKEFTRNFSYEVKETILKYETEIKKLSEKINNYNKIINDIKSLQEEQSAVVEYETERINNILHFVTPEKELDQVQVG